MHKLSYLLCLAIIAAIKLTNRMVLKIHVIIGQEAVKVPFDLRDVILP